MLKDKHAFMSALKKLPKKKRKRLLRYGTLLLAAASAVGAACIHDAFLTPVPQVQAPEGNLSSEENIMGSGYQKYLEQMRNQQTETSQTDSRTPNSLPVQEAADSSAAAETSENGSDSAEILSKQQNEALPGRQEANESGSTLQKRLSGSGSSGSPDADSFSESSALRLFGMQQLWSFLNPSSDFEGSIPQDTAAAARAGNSEKQSGSSGSDSTSGTEPDTDSKKKDAGSGGQTSSAVQAQTDTASSGSALSSHAKPSASSSNAGSEAKNESKSDIKKGTVKEDSLSDPALPGSGSSSGSNSSSSGPSSNSSNSTGSSGQSNTTPSNTEDQKNNSGGNLSAGTASKDNSQKPESAAGISGGSSSAGSSASSSSSPSSAGTSSKKESSGNGQTENEKTGGTPSGSQNSQTGNEDTGQKNGSSKTGLTAEKTSSGGSSGGSGNTDADKKAPSRITASSQTVDHDTNCDLRELPRRIVDPEPLEREIIDPVPGSEHKVVPDEKGDGYYAESTGRDNYYYAPPVLIDLRVYKRWNDEDDRDGIRPAEVYFTLQVRKKGTSTWEDANWDNANWGTHTRVPDADGKIRFDFIYDAENPIKAIRNNEMPDENSADRDTLWYCEFQQVLKYKDGVELEYRVLETEIPDPQLSRAHTDYTAYINDIGDDWGGAVYEGDTVVVKDPQCVTDAAESPIGSNGKTTLAPAFHAMDQADDEAETGWVREAYETSYTNYHKPDRIKIDLTKIWVDRNNQDGIRPQTISLELRADGVKANNSNAGYIGPNPLIVDAGNNKANRWYGIFENLYRYRHRGQVIKYTVVEKRLDPVTKEIYTLQYELPTYIDPTNDDTVTDTSNTVNSGNIRITVINEKDMALRDMDVSKVWDDEDDNDKFRPSSIQFTLSAYVHGSYTIITNDNKDKYLKHPEDYNFPLTLNDANSWKTTIKDLYTYANNNGGLYDEEAGDGSLSGGNYNEDHTERIQYHVVENTVTGYNQPKDVSSKHSVTPDIKEVENGSTFKYTMTISNVRIPTKIRIDLTKFWDDGGTGEHFMGNQDGYRNDKSITFELYADGVRTGKTCTVQTGSIGTLVGVSHGNLVMNAANQFILEGAFDDLYAFRKSGVRINYSVKELTSWKDSDKYTSDGFSGSGVKVVVPNDAYSAEPAETAKVGTVRIENVHEREYTEIFIEKSWSGGSAPSGNIIYVLTQDGNEIARKIASASTGRVSFGQWPKYHDSGQKHVYNITEECNIANTSNGTPSSNDGGYSWHVTNRTTGSSGSSTRITVYKRWDGCEQGPEGGTITFTLKREVTTRGNWRTYGTDATFTKTLPTNCPSGSSVTFEGLEKEYDITNRYSASPEPGYDYYDSTGTYKYTVTESVSGASGVSTGGGGSVSLGGSTIFTNTYNPPEMENGELKFRVKKDWDMTEAEDGKLSDSLKNTVINFVLYKAEPDSSEFAVVKQQPLKVSQVSDDSGNGVWVEFEGTYPENAADGRPYQYRISERIDGWEEKTLSEGGYYDENYRGGIPEEAGTWTGGKLFQLGFKNKVKTPPPDTKATYSASSFDCFNMGHSMFNAVMKATGRTSEYFIPSTLNYGRVASHPNNFGGVPTAEHVADALIKFRGKYFTATNPHADGVPRNGTVISGWNQTNGVMTHVMVVCQAHVNQGTFDIFECGGVTSGRKVANCKMLGDRGVQVTGFYDMTQDNTKYMYAYPTLEYEELLMQLASTNTTLDLPTYTTSAQVNFSSPIGKVQLTPSDGS